MQVYKCAHTETQKNTHTAVLFSCVVKARPLDTVWTSQSCNALLSNNCHFCWGINSLVREVPLRFCKGINMRPWRESEKFFFLSAEASLFFISIPP